MPALMLYRCRRTQKGYEAVPTWRPSTTGRELEKRHLNLKIVPEGIRDFGADQGYTPLDLVMAACDCDLDTAFRFLSERLGWASDLDLSATAAAERDEAAAEPVAGAAAKPKAPIDELARFTTVPGLVGEIVDWIVATSRRPNRVLALGAAVTVVGTLIGRRAAGPDSQRHPSLRRRNRTHRQRQAAPARQRHPADGGGQGRQPHRAIEILLAERGARSVVQQTAGAVSAGRDRGFPQGRDQQEERPATRRPLAKSCEHCGVSLSPACRLRHGLNARWRSSRRPALSIFGVSTLEEFHAALQGESVANGFINRFLALTSNIRAPDRDPETDPSCVPASLSRDLQALYLWSGPESLIQIGNPSARIQPEILPWASKEANDCYAEFTRVVEDHVDEHQGSGAYLARCAETAVRLATIRAAGRWGRGARVDLSDIEWGVGVAWTAGQALAAAAQDFLPQNERGEMTEKILAYVRRKHPVKPRDIQQFLKGRLRSKDIKDILSQLVEAGEVEWQGDEYQPTAK